MLALESQVARLDGKRNSLVKKMFNGIFGFTFSLAIRKDAEYKLDNLYSAIRRTLGLRPDSRRPGAAGMTGRRSMSPSRGGNITFMHKFLMH